MPNKFPNAGREKKRVAVKPSRQARGHSFQAPPASLWRRVARVLLNRYTVSISTVALAAVFTVGAYFWIDYSEKIDQRLLTGAVYTTGAGIYSAPKTLRQGEGIGLNELVAYLKSAGSVERNAKADASRSRFGVNGNSVSVEPGVSALIDGKKAFPALEVRFRKDGKGVDSIVDKVSGKQVDSALLEPRILSSIAEEGDGRRKAVTFDDLPKHLVKAITVTEDRAFFEHYGVNLRGIARALWRRYEKEDDSSPLANQGGSSITQQLVKNLLLSNEQTLARKIKEAYMSLIVETRLTKQEIFTLYANQIYLGQQNGVSVYGVGEAANVYFGKDVTQLSMQESAFLAAIIRSPNRYNPFKYPEKAAERRNQVLQSMAETGEISQTQAEELKRTALGVKQSSATNDQQGIPYFSQYAMEEIPKLINDPDAMQHLRVYTSIDPDLQKRAYEIVNDRLAKLDSRFSRQPKGNLNAALVSIRPRTGEIVAMVGGRSFAENQFNRATSAERQPGSVFKPFVYAAAINSAYDPSARVITAATLFKDVKKVFTFGNETYSPNNYGDTFSNKEMTLRDALIKSKNVITVEIGMEMNIGKVMNLAAKAGYPKVEKSYPSMALGTAEATPLQVATAYTAFANLGDRALPMPVVRVTNGEGKTVVEPLPDKRNVMRSDVAYIMNDIMKDVINKGTAGELRSWGFANIAGQKGFAGKTGTSRDGWFAGFTPELVTVVYVGFDDNSDLRLKGSDSAMPIWADFMKEALALHPEWNGDWKMPDGIRRGEIDIRTGKLIREITDDVAPQPSPEAGAETTPTPPPLADNNGVPPEFRRIELFLPGTMPIKGVTDSLDASPIPEDAPVPEPYPQDGTPPAGGQPSGNPVPTPVRTGRIVKVFICPSSNLRATDSCPQRVQKQYAEGTEPKEYCPIHR